MDTASSQLSITLYTTWLLSPYDMLIMILFQIRLYCRILTYACSLLCACANILAAVKD